MKYAVKTFSYLKRSLWLPLIVMIPPSIVACFLSTPYWEVSFVTAFSDYNPYTSLSETFFIIFGDSWQYAWPVIIICALQVVGASLETSAIDRHFRTGRLSLSSPIRLMNYSIGPIAIGAVIMCVISIVWRFVLFGLVALAQAILHAASAPAWLGLAVISVIAAVLFTVHVLIMMPILYFAPVMTIYGYRFRDAAAAAFKLISGKKLFLGFILPLLPCVAVQLTVGFLHVPAWGMWLGGFCTSLFTNIYVTVYVILSFYHIGDLGRRDVLTYEFSIPQDIKLGRVRSDSKKPAEKSPDGEAAGKVTIETKRIGGREDVK